MVSVIIPAYNAETVIERAIQSVLNQTYRNYEIIVVNDGSSDKTEEKVNRIANEFQCVQLINTVNGGVSRARNMGIFQAKGEYITFLDADDTLMPKALEQMRNCLIDTHADICAAKHRIENKNFSDSNAKVIWSSETGIQKIIEDHPATYTAWAKLYKTKKIKSICFPEGRRVHEDSFFVMLCILNGMTMAVCDFTVYNVYVTENSASRCEFSEKFDDILILAEEKKRLILERYPELEDRIDNILIKAHMAYLNILKKAEGRQYHRQEKDSICFIIHNRKYFIPATEYDARWFRIIRNHLYSVYKQVYRIKAKRKTSRRFR